MLTLLKILLLLIFQLSVAWLAAQPPPVYWTKHYGGSGIDSRALVRATSDNGFIMAGFGNSINGDFTTANAGGFDSYFLKLDACGNREWVKTFGGTNQDLVYGVAEIPGSGFYFAGATFSSSLPGYHGGPQDAFVIRTDRNGNTLWTKILGGSGTEVLSNMVVLADTSFIIAGYTTSMDGDGGVATAGNTQGWVLKLDRNGNILWKQLCGGPGSDAFFDITASHDGGFVATGHYEIAGTNGDFYAVKLNSTGSIVWEKTYGGPAGDGARTVRRAAGGGYIVAGNTQSSGGNVTGNHGKTDSWIIKLTEGGDLVWQKCVGGSETEALWEMESLPNDEYLFAAGTTSQNGDIVGNHGAGDALAFVLDGAGNVKWLQCYGGTATEDFFGVSLAPDGSYIFSGMSGSGNGDIPGNHGLTDFILFRLKEKPSVIGVVDTTSCRPLLLNNLWVTRDTTFISTIKDKCGYDSAFVTYRVIIASAFLQSIPDKLVTKGERVVFTTRASGPVRWTGNGLSCYTCLNPEAYALSDSRYIVSLESGTCLLVDTVDIKVVPEDTLYIPSAFTPGNDGKNDVFKPIGFAKDYSLMIFNRWGEKIFQATSLERGWNGWEKGALQPTGIYVYLVRYKNAKGIEKIRKGTVMLIR